MHQTNVLQFGLYTIEDPPHTESLDEKTREYDPEGNVSQPDWDHASCIGRIDGNDPDDGDTHESTEQDAQLERVIGKNSYSLTMKTGVAATILG